MNNTWVGYTVVTDTCTHKTISASARQIRTSGKDVYFWVKIFSNKFEAALCDWNDHSTLVLC